MFVIVSRIVSCVLVLVQLNTLGVKPTADSCGGVKKMPFSEQVRNTAPSNMNCPMPPPSVVPPSQPSTTILASSNANSHDVSHLSVGAYDEFTVSCVVRSS